MNSNSPCAGDDTLAIGKLPADLLVKLLAQAPISDPRVVLGPGIGLDCAVVAIDEHNLLVFKTDPVTFASDELGRYLVQVNANDIATTGAVPRWLLVTLLLPEGRTTATLAEQIMQQIYTACQPLGISVIGGHTEVSHGLDHPIAVAALIGEVTRSRLVTPRGAQPGDRVLLSKGVPIEGASILAREFPDRLRAVLTRDELQRARDLLTDPGISVVRDAQVALHAGRVTAMHDPTEGGIVTALWELAEASGRSLTVDLTAIPVPQLAERICRAFGIDPLLTIASGALLLTAAPGDAAAIVGALLEAGIPCADIGAIGPGPGAVYYRGPDGKNPLPRPQRDELARIYELQNARGQKTHAAFR